MRQVSTRPRPSLWPVFLLIAAAVTSGGCTQGRGAAAVTSPEAYGGYFAIGEEDAAFWRRQIWHDQFEIR